MVLVSGETSIDVSSVRPGGDGIVSLTRRIALDRAVGDRSSAVDPYLHLAPPSWEGPPTSDARRRNFNLISIRSCHER